MELCTYCRSSPVLETIPVCAACADRLRRDAAFVEELKQRIAVDTQNAIERLKGEAERIQDGTRAEPSYAEAPPT